MRSIRPLSSVVLLTLASAAAHAQTSTEHAPGRVYFSPQEKFQAVTGAEVYEVVCQGCHMAQGKGAIGGGMYPALAANGKLASSQYLIYTIVNGRKGMPPLGNALDDIQVAGVANYVRSSFGNAYGEVVTPAEVRALRAK
jgi:mono/diheme cytochrome c family protein